MYTLGVNGWIRGVHDPSAAIFRDGILIAAAEEERFVRRKYAFDQLPLHAIEYCLNAAGISAGELDHLAIGWDTAILLGQFASGVTRLPAQVALDFYLPLRHFPQRQGRAIGVHAIDHHMAHAAAAFATSPFEHAAIVVVDGSGESASTTLAVGDRRRGITPLRAYPFSESLGIFYQALTEYLGFGPFQEGRVMGLAAYGRPCYTFPDVDLDKEAPDRLAAGSEQEILHTWLARFTAITGHAGFKGSRLFVPAQACGRDILNLSPLQKDMAASGQRWIEQQMCRLAGLAMQQTGLANVVLGGGVALNSPANQAVARMPACRRVFVPPAPGDAGVAIGAASAFLWSCGIPVCLPADHVYAGPHFDSATVYAELKRYGVKFRELGQPQAFIAQSIAAGQVLAWMQGGMEFGPRALGSRSILADPRSTAVRDRVNRIKAREAWRPLAPSIKSEHAARYFEHAESPYMGFSVQVAPDAQAGVPGVVHHDGSARLQTVASDIAPAFWHMLDAFEGETGVPLVLNTSFNIGPEPVVCAPVDAIRSYFASELDLLVIDRFVVVKD